MQKLVELTLLVVGERRAVGEAATMIQRKRRLAREGIAVELHVIPGAYHGFAMAQGSPQVEALTRYRDAALARAFAG